MNAGSIFLLALAMSTDAFAAAVCKGAVMQRPDWREAIRAGAIFGCIEALTPIVGWLLGSVASGFFGTWGHWIALAMLSVLGVRMIWAGCTARGEIVETKPVRHSFLVLAATGLATSIDAMAVGASLALLKVEIVRVAISVGLATFTVVTIGVLLGRVLGAVAGQRSEIVGGVVLIAIGIGIVYQHGA